MAVTPSTYSRRWHVVASALANGPGSNPIDLAPVDGRELPVFAQQNGVSSLLDQALAHGRADGLSATSRQKLRQQAHHDAAQNLAQNHSLNELDQLFKSHQLQGLLLKGAALVQLGLLEGRLRPRCDTDLWIHPDQIRPVTAMLAGAGYRIINLEPATRSRKQFQVSREAFDGAPLWFDVHYRLSNRALFANALDFDHCLQATPGGRQDGLRPPEISALLLHLCLHLFGHGRGREQDRLLWLFDIHSVYGGLAAPERGAFEALALASGHGALCAHALRACREAFNTSIADTELALLDRHRNEEMSARLLRASPWRWAWTDFQAQEGLGKKFQFLQEIIRNQITR